MHELAKIVICICVLAIIRIAAVLLLPIDYAAIISIICTLGIRLIIIVNLICFFWPYIKRGFQWLVDHREE